MTAKRVVLLNGPIGAGKTTLGRAAARILGGRFIDGDDYADHSRPWFCSLRRTTDAIVETALRALREAAPVVIVAYPLNRATWFYICRGLHDAGVATGVISLRASYERIIGGPRGRAFTDAERERIRVMLAEGYAERPFSDLIFDTDLVDFDTTAIQLAAAIQGLQLSIAAPGLAPHSVQDPS